MAASTTPQARTTVTLLCAPRVGSNIAEPDFGADCHGRVMTAASAPHKAPTPARKMRGENVSANAQYSDAAIAASGSALAQITGYVITPMAYRRRKTIRDGHPGEAPLLDEFLLFTGVEPGMMV